MLLAAAVAVSSPASSEEFIGSIWYPQTHPLDHYGYVLWSKKVEEQSNGELKPNIFYGEALLPAKAHLSGLQDGIAQITHHAGTYTPSELPEDNVISMLAMGVGNTHAAALAMTDFGINDPEMQARFEQLGIVFLGGFATPPYILMCTKPIKTLADLQGVKIRTPGAVQADWARSVGAVPVTVPSTEMFTGLEKGQLDCAANAGNDLKTRSLWDVAKHTNMVSLGLYFHGWQYAANADWWKGLSPEHRRVLMNTIAESIPETMNGYLGLTAEALAEAPSKGVTIHTPDPEVQKSIDDFAASTGRATAISVGKEKFGLENPEALIDRFLATYNKWEGLLATVDTNDSAAVAALVKAEIFDKVDDTAYGTN
jgi:TRAP-type C4-dicarboxylate transport system substrate-binding protein